MNKRPKYISLLLTVSVFLSIFVPGTVSYASDEMIVDVMSGYYKETVGTFETSAILGYEDSPGRMSSNAPEGKVPTAEWTPYLDVAGIYKVSFYNRVSQYGAPQVTVELKISGETEFSKVISQRGDLALSSLIELGEFELPAGQKTTIVATAGTQKSMMNTHCVVFELIREIESDEKVVADVPDGEPYYDERIEKMALPVRDVSVRDTAENCMKLYVSLDGDDSASGAIDSPLRTIEAAKAKIREIKKTGMPEGGISVYLREGIHSITKEFTLTAQDSGTEDSPICYRAYPGEEVSLVGGYVLDASQFVKVTDEEILRKVPESARENLMVYDIANLGGVTFKDFDFRPEATKPPELIVDGEVMTVARWPNVGYATYGKVIDYGSTITDSRRYRGFTIEYVNPRIERWVDAENPFIAGYWRLEYNMNHTGLINIDREKKWLSTNRYSTAGVGSDRSFYVHNLLEEIDIPGEWFLSTKTQKLYLYPKEGFGSSSAVLSEIEGGNIININGASNILIKGLTIEGSRSKGISMTGNNNLVAGCTIRNVVDEGVMIYGTNSGIRDSEISYTGLRCVRVFGGNRTTLTPANNFVENCEIHHPGRIMPTHGGVQLETGGVGNRISNNYIHHVDAQGVSAGVMNECVIENNLFDITSTKSSDCGAIYIGNGVTGRGLVIRNNIIRDVVGPSSGVGGDAVIGIYIDNYGSGVDIYNNTIVGADYGFLLNGGRNVSCRNNVVVDCKGSYMVASSIGAAYAASFAAPNGMHYISATEALGNPLWLERYPDLQYVLKDAWGQPKNGFIVNNIGYNSGGSKIDNSWVLSGSVFSNKLYDTDPGFDESGYMLKSDAALYTDMPEFEPIDYSNIGLYKGGLRTDSEIDTYRMAIDEFGLTSPANGAVNIDPQSITLQWDDTKCKEEFTVYVSRDKEFSDVVRMSSTHLSAIDLSNALPYGTTLYWRVHAQGKGTAPNRWNKGGIYSFTTISIEDKYEMLSYEADTLLTTVTEGTSEGQVPAGSIATLKAEAERVKEIMASEESTLSVKKGAITSLKEAIDVFASATILPDENAVALFEDFNSETVGDKPFGVISRNNKGMYITVEKDPLDDDNIVTMCDDHETVNSQRASRTFPYQTKVSLDCRVYSKDAEEMVIKLSDSSKDADESGILSGRKYYASQVIFGRDKNIYIGNEPYGTWEPERWYNVRIDVDTDKGIYDAYINGKKIASDVPINNKKGSGVGLVIFATGDSFLGSEDIPVGKMYIDDIIVTTPVDKGRNSYVAKATVNGKNVDNFLPEQNCYNVGENVETLELDTAKGTTVTLIDSKRIEGAKIAVVRSGNGRSISSFMFRP